MRITNAGRGIHQREINGTEALKTLPPEWYGFTNLELSLAPGQSREIDAVLVIEDRILLVDWKDWRGRIKSADGRWLQNDRDMGQSPVEKVRANARKLAEVLKRYLQEQAKRRGESGDRVGVPWVQGCVVLTSRPPPVIEDLAENERSSVFLLDDLLRCLPDARQRDRVLGPALWIDRNDPLTAKAGRWRQLLGSFFNVQTGPFRPQRRVYGTYRALGDETTFKHPLEIYSEFEAEEDAPGRAPGLLRLWNFSKAAERFQVEEGRAEIAGRERAVIAFLKERSPEFDAVLLQPKDSEPERSVGYWEVFEKRRRLRRLSEMATTEESLTPSVRIDLSRALLASAKAMHDLDAAHLDFGGHSIWVEAPSTVKVSHLLAASYPSVESLGEHRYRFLATPVTLPETCFDDLPATHKQRDVFLLGVSVHRLLFGAAPQAAPGAPPEWNDAADEHRRYQQLHDWFSRALEWTPSARFCDAGEALAAFNAALAGVEPRDLIARLDRFRRWPDQMEFLEAYPRLQNLKRSDRSLVWRSERDGRPVIVKLWRRGSWGEDRLEGPRILRFLEHAEALAATPPAGTARLLEAAFLGDAITVVSEFVEGAPLDQGAAQELRAPSDAIGFVLRLADIVNGLHDGGIVHGDLKPANVIVQATEDGPAPVLIDLLDFAPAEEGEIVTSAYCPPAGGRQERDRYAVVRIAEEIFSGAELTENIKASVSGALDRCRNGVRPNSTLLPLVEALRSALEPPAAPKPSYAVTIVGAPSGPVLSDEGRYAVSLSRDRTSLLLRGAAEELELKISGQRFTSARRRSVDQKTIAQRARHDVLALEGDLVVTGGLANDLTCVEFLLNDPAIVAKLRTGPVESEPVSSQDPDEADAARDDDAALDALVESATAEAAAEDLDVPALWRCLMDVERELTIEGLAAGESAYRSGSRRHVLPFTLEKGGLDGFERDDKILVSRFIPREGNWRRVGLLDVTLSTPDMIAVEGDDARRSGSSPLVREGERLRFTSFREMNSRTLREKATSRILARQTPLPELIDVFTPTARVEVRRDPVAVDVDDVRERYGLNRTQAEAFRSLLQVRPIGLLQGPPGTGKTKFIASFVHHALTSGLARNVLLASQSHEAVNNAAEAVLRHFVKTGGEPSLVRVGQEGSVSDALRPYHAERVEGRYKDRFRAERKERLGIMGARLGIPSDLVQRLILAETALRPVMERIDQIGPDDPAVPGLIATADRLRARLGLTSSWDSTAPDAYSHLVTELTQDWEVSEAQVARFLAVSGVGRDWLGSVATHQRSFETFLAGTRQIVAGTCVGLGRSALGLTQARFDLVVVDEAARCTASELAVPMQSGRWVLLVGDHRQLEPHHRPEVVSAVAEKNEIPKTAVLQSDFERVFDSPYGCHAGHALDTQYRMAEPIGRLVSEAFYDGKLRHGRQEPLVKPGAMPELLTAQLGWISTDGLGAAGRQRQERGGSSLFNEAEADIIIGLLRRLDLHAPFQRWLDEQPARHAIGIICTYAAQRELLARRLPAAGLSAAVRERCKIDTVDSYQGKENPIVILSLVRNNLDGPLEGGVRTIAPGFMARPNRINVALSRAMDHLFIVGARQGWRAETAMGQVCAAFGREVEDGRAAELDATSFIDGPGQAPPAAKPAREKSSEVVR